MNETVSEISTAAREFILAFADDEHLMGQRHTEWIGVAPFLEEDLAFASIGQDELGHAAALYALLVGDDDREIDRLAFRRPAEEYRSCWLVEYETNEWAETMVRHWFYDSAERLRWELLAGSSNPEVADLVARAQREETYHRRHSDGLLDVLLAADESRRRIEFAVTTMWPLAVAMFDSVNGEAELVADEFISEPWSELFPAWQSLAVERFPTVDFEKIDAGIYRDAQAGRTERHDDFETVYDRIREVIKDDPEAIW
ncbi:MAG: 1,2-phenylacetyl-CoA epoxidase subunit PaaC [Acidimicrobiales bacterium]